MPSVFCYYYPYAHKGTCPQTNFQDRLNFFRPLFFTSIDYMYVPPQTLNSGYVPVHDDDDYFDLIVHQPYMHCFLWSPLC